MQCIDRAHPKRKGEPQPHQPLAKQGFKRLAAAIVGNHGQRQLDHGIGQALVFHPLAPHDHHQTYHGQKKRKTENSPIKKRKKPNFPGYGTCGIALVESPNCIAPLGHRPLRHIGLHQVGPPILWGGIIMGSGNHRQQLGRQAATREGIGQQNNEEHHGQFAPLQRQAGT